MRLVLYIVLMTIAFVSCTIQKRTVNKGYFVQWHWNKLISNKDQAGEEHSELKLEEKYVLSLQDSTKELEKIEFQEKSADLVGELTENEEKSSSHHPDLKQKEKSFQKPNRDELESEDKIKDDPVFRYSYAGSVLLASIFGILYFINPLWIFAFFAIFFIVSLFVSRSLIFFFGNSKKRLQELEAYPSEKKAEFFKRKIKWTGVLLGINLVYLGWCIFGFIAAEYLGFIFLFLGIFFILKLLSLCFKVTFYRNKYKEHKGTMPEDRRDQILVSEKRKKLMLRLLSLLFLLFSMAMLVMVFVFPLYNIIYFSAFVLFLALAIVYLLTASNFQS